jgi:hypothetical protein
LWSSCHSICHPFLTSYGSNRASCPMGMGELFLRQCSSRGVKLAVPPHRIYCRD